MFDDVHSIDSIAMMEAEVASSSGSGDNSGSDDSVINSSSDDYISRMNKEKKTKQHVQPLPPVTYTSSSSSSSSDGKDRKWEVEYIAESESETDRSGDDYEVIYDRQGIHMVGPHSDWKNKKGGSGKGSGDSKSTLVDEHRPKGLFSSASSLIPVSSSSSSGRSSSGISSGTGSTTTPTSSGTTSTTTTAISTVPIKTKSIVGKISSTSKSGSLLPAQTPPPPPPPPPISADTD